MERVLTLKEAYNISIEEKLKSQSLLAKQKDLSNNLKTVYTRLEDIKNKKLIENGDNLEAMQEELDTTHRSLNEVLKTLNKEQTKVIQGMLSTSEDIKALNEILGENDNDKKKEDEDDTGAKKEIVTEPEKKITQSQINRKMSDASKRAIYWGMVIRNDEEDEKSDKKQPLTIDNKKEQKPAEKKSKPLSKETKKKVTKEISNNKKETNKNLEDTNKEIEVNKQKLVKLLDALEQLIDALLACFSGSYTPKYRK